MRTSRLLLCLLLFPLLACGCAYSIRPSGYLDSYANFNYRDLPDLKIRSAGSPESMPSPDVIIVRDVEIGVGIERVAGIREYAGLLRQKVYDRVLVQYRKSAIVTLADTDLEIYQSLGRRIYEMKVAITQLDPGSSRLRYWIGYGAGAAFIQLEGRLVDLEANKTVCSFVVCDRNGGEPWCGFSPKGASDAYCITQSFDTLVRKLVWSIRPFL